MAPLISIIVPVYKVEQFLHRCVDSILAQTFTDFELLLIDDGSPDKCGEICDSYVSLDSRIKVFHKENGGISSARNLGIENAKGKFIAFIDDDDAIAPDYLEALIPINDEDMSVCSFSVTDNYFYSEGLKNRFITKEQFAIEVIPLLSQLEFIVPWCKLFKSDIIKEHNIRFPKVFPEDPIFFINLSAICK